MNPLVGWTLALVALVAGFSMGGWSGLVLAVTVVAFWLILQFNQTMRVMRNAAQSPVGHVANAVMLHAKLNPGMRMLDVVKLTRSLGLSVGRSDAVVAWASPDGARVVATFANGRLASWTLERTQA